MKDYINEDIGNNDNTEEAEQCQNNKNNFWLLYLGCNDWHVYYPSIFFNI